MREDLNLSPSMEDYLEAIAYLKREGGKARVSDIAARLGYAMPSVTEAIKNLKANGLVDHERYEAVELTALGQEAANDIVNRHRALYSFLAGVLGLEPELAERDACQMEHAMSPETLWRLVRFIEHYHNCPSCDPKWFESEPGGASAPAARAGSTPPLTLNDLTYNQKGEILKLKGKGPIRRRLMEMGFTSGSVVKMERVAPLDDPLEVMIKGYHISLRREEAINILISRIIDEPDRKE